MKTLALPIACLAVLLPKASLCQNNSAARKEATVAITPPMGWNSWDSYGLSVTEQEFKANANVLSRKLKRYGWEYAVVDEGWYLENPAAKPGSFRFSLDENGRYTPAPVRFPSAAGTGFKILAGSIHAMGLKFGIHIIRGIPREAVDKNLPIAGSSYHASDAADRSDTCPWNKDNYGLKNSAAGQAYYDSIAQLYASWGVDFLKVDCIASHPYKGDEIRMMSEALLKTGRPIVLSLSPGPAPLDKSEELRRYAQMWRISNDVWDHWAPWPGREWSQNIRGQFATAEQWAPYIGLGGWPDADMLPIGYLGPRPGQGKARQTELSQDEQRTLLTLWSIFRSPLVVGGNLTRLDNWTSSLLTNQEVINVNQRSEGNHTLTLPGQVAAWMAQPASKSGWYLAMSNLTDNPGHYTYKWSDLGLARDTYRVRDLWGKKDLGTAPSLSIDLAPHASILYRLEEIH